MTPHFNLDAEVTIRERLAILMNRRFRAVNSRHLIPITVAAVVLALSAPESSLGQATLPDSAVSAQQQQQELPGQIEEASPVDAVSRVQPVTSNEDNAVQNARTRPRSGTSNDRLFNVLPNFLTLENSGELPPLSTGGKFSVVARGTFDYVQIPWYGLLAGLSQAENSEPGYGHGAAGYGKRYGAYVADGTIENFMVGAVVPSLLRQDPRFYQSSNGRFLHRLGYAVSRIVITRSDSGGEQFNYSEVLGSAISAGISTYSYHPHADRTLPNTLSVWGSQVGYDTISVVIKEFWPDIRRIIRRRPQPEGTDPH
jgi:hypothetical protein